MIRVTIEMVPGGIERRKRHMATIEIQNDIDRTVETIGRRGDYVAKFSHISQTGQQLGWYDRAVHVRNVARYQSGAVYRILQGALNGFFEEK